MSGRNNDDVFVWDDESKLGEYAWFDENALALNVGENYPHKIGMKKPNPWGLYDMHGNVWDTLASASSSW